MPGSGGIEALRKKLHDRMAQLRNRGRYVGEAGDRDALLEERRSQRAAMRDRRRKERKEKIRHEAETKGKKNKDRREEKQKGNATKVRRHPPHELKSQHDNLLLDSAPCTRQYKRILAAARSTVEAHNRHLWQHQRPILFQENRQTKNNI